jgi:hypothetical protein
MATKSTKKIIRNLHAVPVNLRFGSRKDPYYLTLNRRGESGDWVEVPGDFTEHPDFNRNLGLAFEIISSAEAGKIQYGERSSKPAIEEDRTFKLERMSDTSTTIGMVDADAKAGITRATNVGPMRSNATGTVDNPVPAERPVAEADGDTPPVSPELPAFGGVEKGVSAPSTPQRATRARKK